MQTQKAIRCDGCGQAAGQEFATIWKDAYADIPVLAAAKAEYAKLH